MEDQFDYVMALVSVVIGLALTHVLGALGSAVHRRRGHGPPIRLEPVYLLWVGFVLLWTISFWWWEYKFRELRVAWSFGLYLFVLFYAVLLYGMSVVLVPDRMDGLEDSYAYFMSGRRWFFGLVLLAVGVDLIDSAFKSRDWAFAAQPLLLDGGIAVGAVIAMVVANRAAQLAIAAAMFVLQLWITWSLLGVLGNW